MSYKTEVIIHAKRPLIFKALTEEIQEWWGRTSNSIHKSGDVFTMSFGLTRWQFTVAVYEPDHKLVWRCVKANHVVKGYEGIEEEWLNTSVEWTLNTNGTGTTVQFIHNGLRPELNCYEICSTAWEMFVSQSLKRYIETGKGTPVLD